MIGNAICLMLFMAGTPASHPTKSATPAALHAVGAAQAQNSITGSVYNESRRPVENLRVELLDEVDGVIASTYTRGSGHYAFYRLSSGTFQVRVLTVGTDYEGSTQRVTLTGSLLGGRAAQSEQVDFMLKPRRDRDSSTSISANPGSVFVQEVPKDARAAYERALKGIDGGKSKEEVLTALQQAVALFPNYFAALDLLGQEYIRRENYEAAQPVLTKAVAVNSRSSSCWYALGYAQYKLRLLTSAADSLTKSASLNGKSANTHLALGTVQRLQKQWSVAETHLKQAMAVSRTPIAEAHWQLALLYNQTGRFAEAAAELDLFLKAQPDSRDAEKIRRLIIELRKKK